MDVINFVIRNWYWFVIALLLFITIGTPFLSLIICIGLFVGVPYGAYRLIRYLFNKAYEHPYTPYHKKH